jgi:Fe-S cluster assembly protein SufD
LQAHRAAAFGRFESLELPTEAEEVWRYSRISELPIERFAPASAGTPSDEIAAPVQRVLDAVGERAGLVLTVNGRIARVESEAGKAETGALASTHGGSELLGVVAGEPDAFVTMNAAFAADPVMVRVPSGVAQQRPFVVVHWVDADAAAVFPRTVIEVGESAEATVVELVASEDVLSLVAPVTELSVAPAGILRYVTVQDLGPRMWQVGYQASQVDNQATLLSATVALGGDYARLRADSRLIGTGATANLLAVYFGASGQMHDFRTLQDHDAPKTNSELLFKGAVAGTAHSVYSGLIRVRPGAKGTNAFQTNRNLVLSEGARADSVPNLEIEENEVACSHASAVGPIDEEQRYYLETRGVPSEVADRLVVLGFLRDVVDRIPVGGLRSHLGDVLGAKLDRSDTNLLAEGE